MFVWSPKTRQWGIAVGVVVTAPVSLCVSAQREGVRVEMREEDGISRTSLPVFLGRPLKPVSERGGFEWRWGCYSYELSERPPVSTEGFDDEEEAVKAAKEFLQRSFGELPDPIYATNVSHRKGEGPVPGDPDLWIVFEARHNWISLAGCGAVVYFAGKTVVSVRVSLFAVEPIAGSERPIISKEEAINVWEEWIAALMRSGPQRNRGLALIEVDPSTTAPLGHGLSRRHDGNSSTLIALAASRLSMRFR